MNTLLVLTSALPAVLAEVLQSIILSLDSDSNVKFSWLKTHPWPALFFLFKNDKYRKYRFSVQIRFSTYKIIFVIYYYDYIHFFYYLYIHKLISVCLCVWVSILPWQPFIYYFEISVCVHITMVSIYILFKISDGIVRI